MLNGIVCECLQCLLIVKSCFDHAFVASDRHCPLQAQSRDLSRLVSKNIVLFQE